MDRNLNELLKWSIENTKPTPTGIRAVPPTNGESDSPPEATAATPAPAQAPAHTASRGLSAEAINALMGGPSDAELMQASMAAITSPDEEAITIDDRVVAFDNFEQLVESLDNANNLLPLGLWPPLLGQLEGPHPPLRRMAAWCVGTAVQNNQSSQEAFLAAGGLPRLVALATDAAEQADVRRKAVYALSSACRNFQPAMDACLAELARLGRELGEVDAMNMDAVDEVMNTIKQDFS